MFYLKTPVTLQKKSVTKAGEKDISTEEKIMEAARIVFTKKGYAGTRTRDIAEEAGINLALLNYYFRSKEKLFTTIMQEKVQLMFGLVFPIVTDETTTLEEKVEKIADSYVNLLLAHPDLPIFVLSEIRSNPERFRNSVNIAEIMGNSSLVKQLHERRSDLHPVHFMMSLMGMSIFPFVSKPILFPDEDPQNEAIFRTLMEQRKSLIPQWVKAALNC